MKLVDDLVTQRTASSASRSGPLPWLDWRWSLLFPVGVVLLILTLLVSLLRSEPEIHTIQVQNGVDGTSLAGATVRVGESWYRTNELGEIRIEEPAGGTEIEVGFDGFRPVRQSVQSNEEGVQQVAIRPALVQGTLTDSASGEPIAGAEVLAINGNGETLASSTTAEDGSYLLRNVPEGASLRVQTREYGVIDQAAPEGMTADFSLERQVVTGQVLNAAGDPLQGAVVQAGDLSASTAGDGTFELVGVARDSELRVMAPGYEDQVLSVPASMELAGVQLEQKMIKGIYANLGILASEDGLDSLIEIANTTEVNAIVIDIKQDTIYYDSQVQFFRDAGTVRPVFDVQEVLQKLRDNDIYAIARLVVFQDPLVAEARPDLAVMDESGDLWRNEMGVAWVSAFNEELWDANIALALEAVNLGFDEIQYDYVRFPSDGDLTTADFGRDYTAEAREAAITEFMRRSYEAIHAEGGKLAADLFGYITLVDDEQYIGQRFSSLEPYLDYVCMMIYPSHFQEGNIASAPGHPNDYPYETIYESLERAEQLVPGSKEKFRPWLQDFNYGGLRDYTAEDVRAQIDAAEEFGASGWMLWGDPRNITVEALEPEGS